MDCCTVIAMLSHRLQCFPDQIHIMTTLPLQHHTVSVRHGVSDSERFIVDPRLICARSTAGGSASLAWVHVPSNLGALLGPLRCATSPYDSASHTPGPHLGYGFVCLQPLRRGSKPSHSPFSQLFTSFRGSTRR